MHSEPGPAGVLARVRRASNNDLLEPLGAAARLLACSRLVLCNEGYTPDFARSRHRAGPFGRRARVAAVDPPAPRGPPREPGAGTRGGRSAEERQRSRVRDTYHFGTLCTLPAHIVSSTTCNILVIAYSGATTTKSTGRRQHAKLLCDRAHDCRRTRPNHARCCASGQQDRRRSAGRSSGTTPTKGGSSKHPTAARPHTTHTTHPLAHSPARPPHARAPLDSGAALVAAGRAREGRPMHTDGTTQTCSSLSIEKDRLKVRAHCTSCP